MDIEEDEEFEIKEEKTRKNKRTKIWYIMVISIYKKW